MDLDNGKDIMISRTACGTDPELSGVDDLGSVDDGLIHTLDGRRERRHDHHLREV